MHPNFPDILTIELPALQREALREIRSREPHLTPARLLERLLAVGIASKLRVYPEAFEDSSTPKRDDNSSPDGTSVEPLHLRLSAAQTARVRGIAGVGAHRTAEEVAMWMLEWGLDAYEESLEVIEPTDFNNGVGVR